MHCSRMSTMWGETRRFLSCGQWQAAVAAASFEAIRHACSSHWAAHPIWKERVIAGELILTQPQSYLLSGCVPEGHPSFLAAFTVNYREYKLRSFDPARYRPPSCRRNGHDGSPFGRWPASRKTSILCKYKSDGMDDKSAKIRRNEAGERKPCIIRNRA
jgi:hypothetical protein